MSETVVRISKKGKTVTQPGVSVCGVKVITTGRFLKIARVHDEMFQPGNPMHDPEAFCSELRASGLAADVFTFAQRQNETQPKFNYKTEWDNAALIPMEGYDTWLNKSVEPDVRKAIKKAYRLGLEVRTVPFDDAFVAGIKTVYDETPIRQGRPFWHYGKDLETIRNENSNFIDRCEWFGAFVEGELVGFLELVYVDKISIALQILSKQSHSDKKPTNALIAKAVEVSEARGMTHLDYGKYVYNNEPNNLTEFKRRCGFKRFDYPRFYVPLTATGAICLKVNGHRDFRSLCPPRVIATVRSVRRWYYSRTSVTGAPANSPGPTLPVSGGKSNSY